MQQPCGWESLGAVGPDRNAEVEGLGPGLWNLLLPQSERAPKGLFAVAH
jgi:hypothetical protein